MSPVWPPSCPCDGTWRIGLLFRGFINKKYRRKKPLWKFCVIVFLFVQLGLVFFFLSFLTILADPGFGAFLPLDPKSVIRNEKNPDPGKNTRIISELCNNFLGWKCLNFADLESGIRWLFNLGSGDSLTLDPGFGTVSYMVKFGSRIRDKHPVSATLILQSPFSHCCFFSNGSCL